MSEGILYPKLFIVARIGRNLDKLLTNGLWILGWP